MNAKEWNDNVLKVSVIISDNFLSMPVLDFTQKINIPPPSRGSSVSHLPRDPKYQSDMMTDMAVIVQSLKITGSQIGLQTDRDTGQITGDQITGDQITGWIKDRIIDHMAQTFSTITDHTEKDKRAMRTSCNPISKKVKSISGQSP